MGFYIIHRQATGVYRMTSLQWLYPQIKAITKLMIAGIRGKECTPSFGSRVVNTHTLHSSINVREELNKNNCTSAFR